MKSELVLRLQSHYRF